MINEYKFNKDGYDKNGFNHYGFDKVGFNRNGFDRNGFDKDGHENVHARITNLHKYVEKYFNTKDTITYANYLPHDLSEKSAQTIIENQFLEMLIKSQISGKLIKKSIKAFQLKSKSKVFRNRIVKVIQEAFKELHSEKSVSYKIKSTKN